MNEKVTLKTLMDPEDKSVPTSAEYWDALKAHDWYYHFSDDGRVWRRGEAQDSALRRVWWSGEYLPPKEGDKRKQLKCRPGFEVYKELYYKWGEHMFLGEAWKTEKAPCPPRPDDPSAEDLKAASVLFDKLAQRLNESAE